MTIGAAPRPDLTDALRAALPEVLVVEAGAIDGLPDDEAPPPVGAGGYPLTTRRRDGQAITASEAWLTPRVQAGIDRVEASGVAATLLLCAGGFASVTARGPLVRPFDVAVERLRELGARRLRVIVPIEGQVAPSRARWSAAGFAAETVAGSPLEAGRLDASDPAVDAVVLDFVGHPVGLVAEAAVTTTVPVIDLLAVSIEALVATMRR